MPPNPEHTLRPCEPGQKPAPLLHYGHYVGLGFRV